MAKPKNKEKATSTPKKEALNEESRDTKKMGEKEVLAPARVSDPFPQRMRDEQKDRQFSKFVEIDV